MPYQTIPIPIAVRGLNKDLQPTQIPASSPNMKNMNVKHWGVQKRLGMSELGINLPIILSGDSGIGMELIQYPDARGVNHNIAITTTCAYLYDSSFKQWIDIMPSTQMQDCESQAEWVAGSDITLSDESTIKVEGSNALKMLATDAIAVGAEIASTTTFDDSADLSDYGAVAHVSFWFYSSKAAVSITVHVKDSVGADDIEALSFTATLADTWYHVCREVDLSAINTATSLSIDTETALVATDFIIIDDIRASSSFSGSNSNRWSHSIATDPNEFTNNGGAAIIISNNVDKPYYFEGQDSDRFQLLDVSTFTSFGHSKEIIEFWNHFFHINYNNGNTNVRSLVYTDLGNIDEYVTGTSGSNTLTDSIGKALRAKKLGSDMIIYSESSITTCRYLGGIILFIFPTLVYETGLFAEKGIWEFVNAHYFIGTDQKIYRYHGGQQLIPIGTAIEDSFFESMDTSKRDMIVVGLDPSAHKLYFFAPESSDTYANKAYVYNYKQTPPTWEFHEFNDTVRDFSIFSSKNNWYADGPELAGTYADERADYADASHTQSGHPVAVILTHDGYILQLDEGSGLDNDANIECIYDTMDLTADLEEHNIRTAWISFNMMSTIASATVDMYYSIDGGLNWININTNYSISGGLANKWTQHRIPIDVTERKLRLRLTQNSSKDLQIRAASINMDMVSAR